MRRLLDINVLIALMDSDHAFHQRAHAWWAEEQGMGLLFAHRKRIAANLPPA